MASYSRKCIFILFFLICITYLVIFAISCEKKETKNILIIKTAMGKEMAQLPGGWFEMGSKKGRDNESPVHKVWVDDFLIDIHEVTQEEYEKLMNINPSHFKGPKNPAEQISWADAVLYCNARSRAENLKPCYDEETGKCDFSAEGYRLPTEAEWEYACRAGTKTEFFFGRDLIQLKDYAWYIDNSLNKTHPVAQKKPNPWGLYDMYGNVAEWCNDIYSENYYAVSPEKNPQGPAKGKKYVLRGGSWNSNSENLRSSFRSGEDPGFQDACFARDDIGFRCVRKLVSKTSKSSENVQYANLSPIIQKQAPRTYKTGLVYDDIYLQHKTRSNHPESPQRLVAIMSAMKDKLPDIKMIKPRSFSDTSQWLTNIHSDKYIERLKKSCQNGEEYIDSIDTPISKESYSVAVMAVGGVLSAIDQVMEKNVRNVFCAVRPPGHHALRDKAMGFCLFNNVAIGARYIQKKHGLSKILIVDWDIHHGNGTQDAFYDDPTVLYFSIHRSPFYPGTGDADETGTGKGLGYTINVPMKAGSGDKDYLEVFENILKPKGIEFSPDFILISAGFDAHKDDPLGGMNITANGFARMTEIVKYIAEKCCDGRLVSVLEGGYSIEGLSESVKSHISVLMN